MRWQVQTKSFGKVEIAVDQVTQIVGANKVKIGEIKEALDDYFYSKRITEEQLRDYHQEVPEIIENFQPISKSRFHYLPISDERALFEQLLLEKNSVSEMLVDNYLENEPKIIRDKQALEEVYLQLVAKIEEDFSVFYPDSIDLNIEIDFEKIYQQMKRQISLSFFEEQIQRNIWYFSKLTLLNIFIEKVVVAYKNSGKPVLCCFSHLDRLLSFDEYVLFLHQISALSIKESHLYFILIHSDPSYIENRTEGVINIINDFDTVIDDQELFFERLQYYLPTNSRLKNHCQAQRWLGYIGSVKELHISEWQLINVSACHELLGYSNCHTKKLVVSEQEYKYLIDKIK